MILLAISTGCGRKRPSQPRPARTEAATNPTPRLAAIADNLVRFFQVRDGVIQPIAAKKLMLARFTGAAWLDRTELVVLGFPRDEAKMPELWRVSPTSHKQVALLEKSTWDTPRPDPSVEPFFTDFEIIVSPAREVWIGVCRWGYVGDADDCVQRSYVRVLPSFAKQIARPRSRPKPTGWIRPTEFRISIDKPEPGERGGRMRCVDSGGKLHFPAQQQLVTSLRWLSVEPPLYAAEFHVPTDESAGYTEYRVYAACNSAPRLVTRMLSQGPAPYWLYQSERWDIVVHRGAHAVGQLPRPTAADNVRTSYAWAAFAPPRP